MLRYVVTQGARFREIPETLRGDVCDCKLTQPLFYELNLYATHSTSMLLTKPLSY